MTALRNIGAIFQKEWRHYFGSPIAYVALVVWLGLFGLFFSIALGFFLQASASGGPGMGQLNINDWVIGSTLQSMAVVTLFIMPMLTMRLFAEEKRQGTIELLATAPVQRWGEQSYPSLSDAKEAANLVLRLATVSNGELAYRAYQVKLTDYNCAFVARLHNAATPAQRLHAKATIKGWEDDLSAVHSGAATAADPSRATN